MARALSLPPMTHATRRAHFVNLSGRHMTRTLNGETMKNNRNAPVVNAHQLTADDFNRSIDHAVIVKTPRASNFRVVRHSPGTFIVYGRTEFVGGSITVKGIDAVRRLLVTR